MYLEGILFPKVLLRHLPILLTQQMYSTIFIIEHEHGIFWELISVWIVSRPFRSKFWLLWKQTSNDIDPLLDLTAWFFWCLDKFFHCLQQAHCNSPPWIFEITFIAAISSDSSPLFCCKRLGHTILHPVLYSLKSVCKGKRRETKHPGNWQFSPCPCCSAGAGGSLSCLHPSADPKTCEYPLPELSAEPAYRSQAEFLKWFRKAKERIIALHIL